MRRGVFCFVVGAIGNLVDRALLRGAVVDYIDIRLGEHGSWYALAWNISDLVINLGFAHILYDSLVGGSEGQGSQKTKTPEELDREQDDEPKARAVPVSPRKSSHK
jgi:lipoprotein signal peptidase